MTATHEDITIKALLDELPEAARHRLQSHCIETCQPMWQVIKKALLSTSAALVASSEKATTTALVSAGH